MRRPALVLSLFLTLAACSGAPATVDQTPLVDVTVGEHGSLPALDAHVAGRVDALVTLHTFIDPASSRFEAVLDHYERLGAAHDGDVRLVVRAPASPSPAGYDALVALRASQLQGKQREVWDVLSKWRGGWKTGGAIALVATHADEIGLDREAFRVAVEDGTAQELVRAEAEWAAANGADGTLAMNGRFYRDVIEQRPLDDAFAQTLDAARALLDAGTSREQIYAHHAAQNAEATPFGRPFVDSELVPIGHSPTFGNRKGPVKVVAFMNFQCPFSKRAAVTLAQIVSSHPEVELVFKHMPLEFHRQAREAGAISVAAAAQGKFWEMSELLFLNQARLPKENLDELAAELGNKLELDVQRLLDDRARAYAVVDADVALAERIGVRGTPHFFINGQRLNGAQPLARFEAMIAAEVDHVNSLDVHPANLYAEAVRRNFSEPTTQPTVSPRPELPDYADVPVDKSDPVRGATKGYLVTIVEFGSYQCPFCQRVQPTLKQLADKHPKTVRFVYKHRPLPFHKSSRPAAAAAIAAGKQGKFWEMHDALFGGGVLPQPDEIDEHTDRIAAELGLKMKQFRKDRTAADAKIDADDKLAEESGARGTPTFFINGRRLTGAQPLAAFEDAVAQELEHAKVVQKDANVSDDALYREVIRRRVAVDAAEDE